jgi:tetratricopeptide (TPR) repeat protein
MRTRRNTTSPSPDFDKAIGLDPNYAFGFIGRGSVFVLKAQYARTIADFDQAIRLDPKQPVAFDGRGFANFNTGQFAAAARDFAQSLSLDAQDADIILRLHLARARSGSTDTQYRDRPASAGRSSLRGQARSRCCGWD